MFGMGGSEIIVILIVALLFLGPEKLPGAAKSISKGIRDIKKQSRALQQQIESDEQIGGAIRDLKSALRGDPEAPARQKYHPALQPPAEEAIVGSDVPDNTHPAEADMGGVDGVAPPAFGEVPSLPEVTPLTLPSSAGEPGDVKDPGGDEDLAAMVKPASGTVAKGS